MSIQVVKVGIVSDHADTNLDGQPLVTFTVEEEGVGEEEGGVEAPAPEGDAGDAVQVYPGCQYCERGVRH